MSTLADRRRQVDRVDALDDVGAGPALEDVLDQLLVGRDREDDHLDLRIAPLDLVEADESVHLWHAQVEQDDVGLGPAHQRHHLASLSRLADDLEVVGGLERSADAVQDQAVVVGEQDLESELRRHLTQCAVSRAVQPTRLVSA